MSSSATNGPRRAALPEQPPAVWNECGKRHVTFTFRPSKNRAYWRVDNGLTWSTTVGNTIVNPLMDYDEFGVAQSSGRYQVQLAQLVGAGVFNGEMLYLNNGAFVCGAGQSDWSPIEFDNVVSLNH